MGGLGLAEGRKPGGKRGSLRLFVFARAGGEGDTRAWRSGTGGRGPPGAARSAREDKGAAEAAGRRRRVTIILLARGGMGERPPQSSPAPLPQRGPLQVTATPQRPPQAVIWGLGGRGSGSGVRGAPDTVPSSFSVKPWASVCLAGQSAAPPPVPRLGASDLGGQRGCSRRWEGAPGALRWRGCGHPATEPVPLWRGRKGWGLFISSDSPVSAWRSPCCASLRGT